MFEIGSIGADLWQDLDLRQRLPQRPTHLMLVPLSALWKRNENSTVLRELERLGAALVGDALYSRDQNHNFVPALKERLIEFISRTPHTRLVGAVLGEPGYQIPVSRESELVEDVEGALSPLNPRAQMVLRLRYGLDDWQPQVFSGIKILPADIDALQSTVSVARVAEIHHATLYKLRGTALSGYRVVAPNSFGRFFNPDAEIAKDLPHLKGNLSRLPDELRDFLVTRVIGANNEPYNKFMSLQTLLTLDLKLAEISPGVYQEVCRALQDLIAQDSDPVETLIPKAPPSNRFLPEIPLTAEQLTALAGIPIDTIGLKPRTYNCIKRSKILTVGDLFNRTKEQIEAQRQFGVVAMADVELALQRLLLSMGVADAELVRGLLTSGYHNLS